MLDTHTLTFHPSRALWWSPGWISWGTTDRNKKAMKRALKLFSERCVCASECPRPHVCITACVCMFVCSWKPYGFNKRPLVTSSAAVWQGLRCYFKHVTFLVLIITGRLLTRQLPRYKIPHSWMINHLNWSRVDEKAGRKLAAEWQHLIQYKCMKLIFSVVQKSF